MKYIKTYENYRFFDKENIGDIVMCYRTPSYGYHNLKKGKKYEIVDTRYAESFYEIKVKPIENEENESFLDKYYLESYFLPNDVILKKLKFYKNVNKYNI